MGEAVTRRIIRSAGGARIVKENSPLAMTTEDRILLYFSDFRNMEERYVLPQALTQKAIAFAAGIQRKHLSRYLDDMVRDGFLTETKAHIEGEKQRMLEDYTRAVMTAWKDGRVTATERLLVEQLRENLGISKEEQERIETQVMEEVLENRTGIYRAVAEEALEEGPITEDERELLEVLRKKLGLSSQDCRRIEAEIGKRPS